MSCCPTHVHRSRVVLGRCSVTTSEADIAACNNLKPAAYLNIVARSSLPGVGIKGFCCPTEADYKKSEDTLNPLYIAPQKLACEVVKKQYETMTHGNLCI